MTTAALAVAAVLLGIGLYYVRLHLEWRAEVRRRRAERERMRELFRRGRVA